MSLKRILSAVAAIVALAVVASAQTRPIKDPKITGTMDISGITNKVGVRTELAAQPLAANLTALGALAVTTDRMIYFNGTTIVATPLTGFMRTLLDDGNEIAAWSTLGLTEYIDFGPRTLIDSATSQVSVAWDARTLNDSAGLTKVDWEGGELRDSTGVRSIHWQGREMVDSAGNASTNWELRQSYDAGSGVSIDWGSRIAKDSSGTSAIEWDNRTLINATGTDTVNWQIEGLRAAADGVFSVRWGDRNLINAGSVVMLDWSDNTGTREVKLGTAGDGTLRAASVVGLERPYIPRQARMEGLSGFTLRRTISTLPVVSSGISGATYCKRNNSLFLVRNVSGAAGTIYETTLDGTVLRTITNSNFIDTEAVEWVGAIKNDAGTVYDVLIVAEEDHTTGANESSLTLCLLGTAATTLDRTATNGTDPDNVTVTTAYSGGTIANGGIESVAFDPFRSLVYYTAEFRTQLGSSTTPYTSGAGQQFIWKRSITANATTLAFGAESSLCSIIGLSTTVATGTLYNAGTPASPYDIGDMAFDANSDTILLLSDTGDRVVKIDRAGAPVEWLITAGNQPEGVTISPDSSEMWVVGEAQEFYRYGFEDLKATATLTNTATLDFPSTLSTAIANLTITVTGAEPGDVAIVAPPAASVTATAVFFAYVSASNTVTVRFSPKATEDPASGVYRVTVIKQ